MSLSFAFLELPRELQLMVLTHCTYASLKHFASTCTAMRGLSQHRALDAALFRTRVVDMDGWKRTFDGKSRGGYFDAAMQAWVGGSPPFDDVPQRESSEIILIHSMLQMIPENVWWGQDYGCARLKRTGAHQIEAGPARNGEGSRDEQDGGVYLVELAAMFENATEPPVTRCTLSDTQAGFRHVVHARDTYFDDISTLVEAPGLPSGVFETSGVLIESEDDFTPVTVEQVVRAYCHHASNTILNFGPENICEPNFPRQLSAWSGWATHMPGAVVVALEAPARLTDSDEED